MSDVFLGLLELDSYGVEQPTHGFLAVEHMTGLLVALNVVLDFPLQVLVDAFVL